MNVIVGLLCIVVTILVLYAAYDPFRGTYPYFRVSFDFSRKRNPDINAYIRDALLNDAQWTAMRKNHYRVVGAWHARCEDIVVKSILKTHRRRQYERACDDMHEFVFAGVRSQARYQQRNYVKYRYDVNVVDCEVSMSFDEICAKKDELAPGTLAMKEFSEHQRKLMTKTVRERIMKRDNFTCQICGKYMPDRVGLQIDHIIPVSRGGRTEDSNLRVTCSVCNLSKSDKIE